MYRKSVARTLAFGCLSLLVFTSVFADPLGATLSGTNSAKVGDTVVVSVTYTANATSPIFTSSADITYDAEALSFIDVTFDSSWLAVGKFPYEMSEAGHLVRTAGYPGGLSGSDKFITISFKTKKSGTTSVNLTGGMALGENDADMGVAQKSFKINVLGDEPVVQTQAQPQTQPTNPTSQTIKKEVVKASPVQEKIEKKIEIEKVVLTEEGDINLNTDNLAEGEYIVTVKKVSGKDSKNVLEKRIQVVKATTTKVDEPQKIVEQTFLIRIVNLFKSIFGF
jgi:predicted  nucleic acid-binding Zn-ribbon protein